ncbi:unnamed protein product [Moneuplotes crassus]|uniref:Uncharacterized protein n=1 Tax=Euplotes crassus TaxID=5936 RepID=A0AAD1X8B2_EUPCR|nr:unnamed protein product [Moneuplotes crassus]
MESIQAGPQFSIHFPGKLTPVFSCFANESWFSLSKSSCQDRVICWMTSFTISSILCPSANFQGLILFFDNLYPYSSEFKLFIILSKRASNVSLALAKIERGRLTFYISLFSFVGITINLISCNLISKSISLWNDMKNLFTVTPPYFECKKFQTSFLTIV